MNSNSSHLLELYFFFFFFWLRPTTDESAAWDESFCGRRKAARLERGGGLRVESVDFVIVGFCLCDGFTWELMTFFFRYCLLTCWGTCKAQGNQEVKVRAWVLTCCWCSPLVVQCEGCFQPHLGYNIRVFACLPAFPAPWHTECVSDSLSCEREGDRGDSCHCWHLPSSFCCRSAVWVH